MKIGFALYKNEKGFSVWVKFPEKVIISKDGKYPALTGDNMHLLRNKGGERRITLIDYDWTIIFNENKKVNIYWADVEFGTTPRPVPICRVEVSELLSIYPNYKFIELPTSKQFHELEAIEVGG